MAHTVNENLLPKIRGFGAFDINACFQCGNCTAVCPLAEESAGFPRRVIRLAQIGWEKKLLSARELWLCYACGECTLTCPRKADPAQFMAAARRFATSRYDRTGLARFSFGSAVGNLALFATLSAVFASLLLSRSKEIVTSHPAFFEFIPGAWIHDIGVALIFLIGLAMVSGVASQILHFRRDRRERSGLAPLAWTDLPRAVAGGLYDALAHVRYRRCAKQQESTPGAVKATGWRAKLREPWAIHAAIFWGFLGLLAATTLDYLFKPIGSYVPPWYPIRLLGTVSGLVCLSGLWMAFQRRCRGESAPPASVFFDWFFLLLLAAAVVSGLAAEIVVYLPRGSAAGVAIFVTHVVLAMDLIVMLPLSKFAHAVYRPVALVLDEWERLSAARGTAESAVARKAA